MTKRVVSRMLLMAILLMAVVLPLSVSAQAPGIYIFGNVYCNDECRGPAVGAGATVELYIDQGAGFTLARTSPIVDANGNYGFAVSGVPAVYKLVLTTGNGDYMANTASYGGSYGSANQDQDLGMLLVDFGGAVGPWEVIFSYPGVPTQWAMDGDGNMQECYGPVFFNCSCGGVTNANTGWAWIFGRVCDADADNAGIAGAEIGLYDVADDWITGVLMATKVSGDRGYYGFGIPVVEEPPTGSGIQTEQYWVMPTNGVPGYAFYGPVRYQFVTPSRTWAPFDPQGCWNIGPFYFYAGNN